MSRVSCTVRAAALLALLATACVRHSGTGHVTPAAARQWSGCYVLHWTPRATSWLKGMDSIHLALTTALDSSPSHWHRVPYATTSYYDRGYFGPFWEVRGDSLSIFDGLLSGWELVAVPSDSGFAGHASTFTDVVSSDQPLTWQVIGHRVPCSHS